MSIDLKALSPKQLQKLIDEAKRERQRKQKRAPIESVRRKLTRMATAEGYSLVELFGIKAGAIPRKAPASGKSPTPRRSTKGSKIAPKYRNPDNPSETWSGRGQYPRWMSAAIAAGRKPEDFLI